MIRFGILLLCVLACAGCGDHATPPPSAPPAPRTSTVDPSANAGAANANADVPVARLLHNDPDAVRAYHEAMTAAAAGGGGGGGVSRHQREEYRRTQQALQDLSEEQGLAMLQEMRQRAQVEDDPCDGLFESFGAMTQAAGRDPIVSEREFRDTCSQMPRAMQACFKDDADQSDGEKRYCTRLFGATNPFATTPREGLGPPPGTKRLTQRQRDQINATRRRYR